MRVPLERGGFQQLCAKYASVEVLTILGIMRLDMYICELLPSSETHSLVKSNRNDSERKLREMFSLDSVLRLGLYHHPVQNLSRNIPRFQQDCAEHITDNPLTNRWGPEYAGVES